MSISVRFLPEQKLIEPHGAGPVDLESNGNRFRVRRDGDGSLVPLPIVTDRRIGKLARSNFRECQV